MTNDQPIETQSVAVHQPQPLDVSQAMRIEDIIGQVRLIQEVMRKVMVEKEHYGTIPGCGDKKTLLQPGAQKLTMTFRLAPEYNIQEVNLERGHKEYRIICTLKSIQSGSLVGQGVGVCSTMESKYRWRSGVLKCPECGKETIFKDKKHPFGFYCWSKKGGCRRQFAPDDGAITKQDTGKIENDNPADCYNTVLKIAKKRAFVDATITATAASDIFTQDIGDEESPPPGKPSSEYLPSDDDAGFDNATEKPQGRAASPEPSQHTPEPPKAAPIPTKAPETTLKVGPKYRMQTLNKLQAAPGGQQRAIFHQYATVQGWILPTEDPEAWPLHMIPTTPEAFVKLGEDLKKFERELREGRGVAP